MRVWAARARTKRYGPNSSAIQLSVRDVWGNRSLPPARGGDSVFAAGAVPAHGTVVLRLSELLLLSPVRVVS